MTDIRPAIRLKPREGRRLRAGAPWAFANEIRMDGDAKSLAPGTLVRIEGDDGRSYGAGYFNPHSLIAFRLLAPDAGAEIGRDFFAARFAAALARRAALFDRPYYRLVHAEGDGLPGLVVDRFGGVLVAQVTTAGMEALLDPVLSALEGVIAPEAIVLRNDSPARALEGLTAYVRAAKGAMPKRLTVEENGARYYADAQYGQKTGWYYDQRDNRAFVARLAPGRTLLDAYCYTGGFAILAARAGAREAAGIDSSDAALALAADAAAANAAGKTATFIRADVTDELERLAGAGERFGVVVCDPPPFVRAKKDLEAGARAYRKLARLAARVTERGGFLLLASCSHNIAPERFAQECAIGIARAGRTGALIRQAGAGPDHPVHPMLGETAYLKALVYALD